MARIIPLPRRASAAVAASTSREEAAKLCDRDLQLAGVLFWLASVARVITAFVQHEVFGVESSLAFLCAVLLPWLFWHSLSGHTLRGGAGAGHDVQEEQPLGVVIPFGRAAPRPVHSRDDA